jgi:hypothetical protein
MQSAHVSRYKKRVAARSFDRLSIRIGLLLDNSRKEARSNSAPTSGAFV